MRRDNEYPLILKGQLPFFLGSDEMSGIYLYITEQTWTIIKLTCQWLSKYIPPDELILMIPTLLPCYICGGCLAIRRSPNDFNFA